MNTTVGYLSCAENLLSPEYSLTERQLFTELVLICAIKKLAAQRNTSPVRLLLAWEVGE